LIGVMAVIVRFSFPSHATVVFGTQFCVVLASHPRCDRGTQRYKQTSKNVFSGASKR